MPLVDGQGQSASEKARLLARHGSTLEIAGHIEEALDAYEAASRCDPFCPDAISGQGRCLHEMARVLNAHAGGAIYFTAGLNLLDRAIECFERAVHVNPSADLYLSLALAYDNRFRIEEAEAAYLAAIQIDPNGEDGCEARFNLALIFFMRARGATGAPTDQEALMSRAIELSEEAATVADTIATADHAFAPSAATIHRRLANWYWSRQEFEPAGEHFAGSLRWDPSHHEARAKVAFSKGISIWERFQADPSNVTLVALREAIAELETAKILFNPQDSPNEWASICAHLGTIYAEIHYGDHAGNLQSAISNWQEALRCLAERSDTTQFATWLNMLGIAWRRALFPALGDDLEGALPATITNLPRCA